MRSKSILKTLKNNPITSINTPDTNVCTIKDCKWNIYKHAISFHWEAEPNNYFPNGMKIISPLPIK
jgi:hypothetical protein